MTKRWFNDLRGPGCLAGLCLALFVGGCSSPPSGSGEDGIASRGSVSNDTQPRGLYVRGSIRGDGTVDVRDISYNGVADRKDLTRIGGRYLTDGNYRLTAEISNRAPDPINLRFRVLWYGDRGETLGPGQDTPWTPLTVEAEQSAELASLSSSGSPRFFFLVVALEE